MSSEQEAKEQPAAVKGRVPDRKTMIRDVAVFQLKLIADGLRDLVLLPASIGAAVIALLKKGPEPGTEFYDLLRTGRQSEHWINLFGAASTVHGPEGDEDRFPADIDKLVAKVESFVVEEYRSGGVTSQAKVKLERALAALRERSSGLS
jgi:hypothetical protein